MQEACQQSDALAVALRQLLSSYLPRDLRRRAQALAKKLEETRTTLSRAKSKQLQQQGPRQFQQQLQLLRAQQQQHAPYPCHVSMLDRSGVTFNVQLDAMPHPSFWDTVWTERVRSFTGKDMALLHRQFLLRLSQLLPAMQSSGPSDAAHHRHTELRLSYNAIVARVRELSPRALQERSKYNMETLHEEPPLAGEALLSKFLDAFRNLHPDTIILLVRAYMRYCATKEQLQAEHSALSERLDRALHSHGCWDRSPPAAAAAAARLVMVEEDVCTAGPQMGAATRPGFWAGSRLLSGAGHAAAGTAPAAAVGSRGADEGTSDGLPQISLGPLWLRGPRGAGPEGRGGDDAVSCEGGSLAHAFAESGAAGRPEDASPRGPQGQWPAVAWVPAASGGAEAAGPSPHPWFGASGRRASGASGSGSTLGGGASGGSAVDQPTQADGAGAGGGQGQQQQRQQRGGQVHGLEASIDAVDEIAARLQENLEKQRRHGTEVWKVLVSVIPAARHAAFILEY